MRRWGATFELNLDDNVQRVFYYTGWYERPFLEFLGGELRPDDVYVDVGAHVGIDAVFAARRCARVFAFEPAPDTEEVLRKTVRRLANVEVVPLALSDSSGRLQLRAHPAWHRNDAAVRSLYATGSVVAEVEVVPFDEWADGVPNLRLDVIKIDVEGAERDVLRGMARSLRRLRPRVIAVEVNAAMELSSSTREELHALLGDLGYSFDRRIIENDVFRRG